MSDEIKTKLINVLIDSLDIPESAYEVASARYGDLDKWLRDRSKAKSAQYNPVVSPQGSFRLGTAIRPWKREDYDLDLACKLQHGITKADHTQAELKNIVGVDIEAYRKERGISEKLEEKHRCWRLNYQDQLKFHLDTVPSIPQAEDTRQLLQERMIKAGATEALAQNVSALAIAITDNRHPRYKEISPDWQVSNPEGYAIWFESRMRQAHQFLDSRVILEKVARIDDLPVYKWKTPLQRCVQILKRHRDVMFERDPNVKPISVIITTLAAKAYQGEPDIPSALENILEKMGSLINQARPRIPNPVNPAEDFAEKWATAEGQRLHLEENFHLWAEQVRRDIGVLVSSLDRDFIIEHAMQRFGARFDENILCGIIGGSPAIITPKSHQITNAAKPWLS